MNIKKQRNILMSRESITRTIESLNDLVSTLSEGERTTYNQIIRSIELSKDDFDGISTWSDQSYTRNCIAENEQFELILLCWEKGQRTAIHDHGGEECWVNIIEGEFKETIYKEDANGELVAVKTHYSEAGNCTYMIDFMGFHSLENISDKRSMSLHLYAKPIRNCQVYNEDTQKFVRKELVYDTVQY
jgi:cysteine dioxygenase